jgi:uncharacterized membrane protein YfcA
MKPFGGWVHARRGTVNWTLVRWLCLGSVPAAFLGVLLTRALPDDAAVQHGIQLALGVALVLAAAGLVLKAVAAARRAKTADSETGPAPSIRVRPLPTVILGAAGGLVVGLTSVGSGSLIIVILLALYPALRPNDLVGTDLVQAVPLVAAAAMGHLFFGDLQFPLAGAILLGSIPGVLIGARLSSRAPADIVRAALIVVLVASALKLFGLPGAVVLGTVVAVAVVAALTLVVLPRRARRAVRVVEPGPASEEPAAQAAAISG